MKVGAEEKSLGVYLRKVSTPRKNVDTPRRALSLTVTGPSEALASLHPKSRGMVELYRELTPDLLEKMDHNTQEQKEFTRGLARQVAALPRSEDLVLLVFAFREKGFCPTPRQAEYLADLVAAPFVDAVTVPAILPTDRDSYHAYVSAFLDAFASLDQAPVLGYVPNFAHRDILKTIDFFLKRGIKDFVLEFNGHHTGVLYPNIQGVSRLLTTQLGDDFFIHGLNVGPGAFLRNTEASPSKDFLALLAGIDSIGSKHVRKKMPMKVWRRLAADREKGRRLFSRRDYGYYDPKAYYRRFGGSTDEGLVSAASVCRNPLPQMVRLFNAERQTLEAAAVREHLVEGTLFRYADSKTKLKDDVENVAREWTRHRGQQTLST